MLESFVAPYDAHVVAALRTAGTILVGKANMDEFAMGSSNETSYFGPVRNPWDTGRTPLEVVTLIEGRRSRGRALDLGCGTGSNLRATFALLPAEQSWTLVDYDSRLLSAARERLSAWADKSTTTGDTLDLVKSGKQLRVRFRQADLTRELDAALGTSPDLVARADEIIAGYYDGDTAVAGWKAAGVYTEGNGPFFGTITFTAADGSTLGVRMDGRARALPNGTDAFPDVGASRPHRMRMRVDLPEPFGPSKPRTWLAAIVKLTPLTAE